MNINLDEIDYKIKYIEYPDDARSTYGFLAIGKLNKTKDELKQHFEEYKKYLIQSNLEIELNRLIFIKKENALQEFDKLPNNKRTYLRELIKQATKC